MIATLTEIKFANYTHRYDFPEGFLLVSLPDGGLKWVPLSLSSELVEYRVSFARRNLKGIPNLVYSYSWIMLIREK